MDKIESMEAMLFLLKVQAEANKVYDENELGVGD